MASGKLLQESSTSPSHLGILNDQALSLYDISTPSSRHASHSRKHREQVTSASYDRVVDLWDMRERPFDGNRKEKE